jgi:hypothetical protein
MKASTLEKQQLKAMAASLKCVAAAGDGGKPDINGENHIMYQENEKPNGSEGSKAMLKS